MVTLTATTDRDNGLDPLNLERLGHRPGGPLEVSNFVATDAVTTVVDMRGREQSLTAALQEQLRSANASPRDGVPTAAEILERVDGYVSKGRHPVLTAEQRESFEDLSLLERYVFSKSLDEIDRLDAGEIDVADCMVNVMQHAADVSGGDGDLFVSLVGKLFTIEGGNLPRRLLGAGSNTPGAVLEGIYSITAGMRGGSTVANGFNPNIIDAMTGSTVTHHFGEFLRVGANRWNWLGRRAQDHIDDVKDNPGDVRNGYFAIMLGDGVSDGDLSPHQAVELTRWAFTQDHGAAPPPWGTVDSGSSDFTSGADYRIADWIRAYDQAHPDLPFGQ